MLLYIWQEGFSTAIFGFILSLAGQEKGRTELDLLSEYESTKWWEEGHEVSFTKLVSQLSRLSIPSFLS